MAKKSLILKSQRTPKHKIQAHNRCHVCGRPRAFYRRFQMCRLCLRLLARRGEIPGLTKASW